MPLESLKPDQRVNVKRVSIEVQDEKPEYQGHAEIIPAEKDWDKMQSKLDYLKRKTQEAGEKTEQFQKEYLDLLTNMKILNSEGIDPSDLETGLTFSRQLIEHGKRKGNYVLIMQSSIAGKIIGGEKVKKIDLHPSSLDKLFVNIEGSNVMQAEAGIYLRIFLPNEFSKNKLIKITIVGTLKIDEIKLKELWKIGKIFLDESLSEGEFLKFLQVGSKMRMLFPEEFKKYKISSKTWTELLQYVNESRENSAISILNLTEIMADFNILSANDIQMDEQGLRLINKPEEKESNIPSQPSTKEF